MGVVATVAALSTVASAAYTYKETKDAEDEAEKEEQEAEDDAEAAAEKAKVIAQSGGMGGLTSNSGSSSTYKKLLGS